MKRRLIFTFVGIFVFLLCFSASLFVRDYFYEQNLRADIQKVKVGMTEKEVVEIVGKPSNKQMSDIPGLYWCYDTNSFGKIFDDNPDRLGYLLLEMSSDGKVVRVFGFKN